MQVIRNIPAQLASDTRVTSITGSNIAAVIVAFDAWRVLNPNVIVVDAVLKTVGFAPQGSAITDGGSGLADYGTALAALTAAATALIAGQCVQSSGIVCELPADPAPTFGWYLIYQTYTGFSGVTGQIELIVFFVVNQPVN